MAPSSLTAVLACCALAAASGCGPSSGDGDRAAAALLDPDAFEQGASGLLRARAGSGWEALLRDDDLDGWEVVGDGLEGITLQDGVLAFTAVGGGYVRTVEDFRDFRLRLDFKIGRMANSGVFLRGARDGTDPAYSGCEIQILDDVNWETVTGTALKPYQLTGGLYGSLAPGAAALAPLGAWNTYAIEYRGTRLRVELNGQVLYDVDTLTVPGKPFAERAAEGFIGLQRHAPARLGDEPYVWFRNVFVQRL